jgi:hypothetical protein
MVRLLADEAVERCIGPQVRGQGISLGIHLTVILAICGQQWLLALVSAFSAVPQPEPPPAYTLTILAPPPGKHVHTNALSFHTGPPEPSVGDSSPVIADTTDISFDSDDTRQLLHVLAEYGGLIVFVPVLDRVHPTGAFRPDGSEAAIPASLDHWIRIRLPNTSWWPEVDALCSVANPDGTLEAVAVLPPAYRSALGAAVQARMAEMKSSGRVVGVGLRLEAGQPAGVRVRAIRLATNANARIG